jgi:CHASE2 domain-containing sensor protein
VPLAVRVGLPVIGVVLVLYWVSALHAIELQTVDTRFSLRGDQHPSTNLVVVGIDSRTFSELGLQWPYPRSLHAEVIDRLMRDGARVIVYDVQFTEPTTPVDSTAAARTAAEVQDNTLIEAVKRAGNVVLSTSEVGPRGEENIFGGDDLALLHARAGSSNFPTDPDGVIRRMYHDFHGLPTVPIVAAELASGRAIAPASLGGSTAWIDYTGGPGTIPEVPFATVLHGQAPASDFAGKTVVVGVTVTDLHDVYETPLGGSQLMSGAELVANSIATAERDFPLKSGGSLLDVILIVALGLVAPVASSRFSPGSAIVLSLVIVGTYAVVVQLAFNNGRILPLTYPLVALALGCAAAVVADTFGERRQLRALEDALGPLRSASSIFFISYRRDQSHWPAQILNNELVERFGRASVFIDRAATEAGQIWPRRIKEAIAECSVMLVLIGPGWLDARGPDGGRRLDDPDDWVRREVEAGLERDDAVVVPVLIDGATMPTAAQLPESLKPLADCNAVALAGDDPGPEIDRLVSSIQQGRMRDYFARQRLAQAR